MTTRPGRPRPGLRSLDWRFLLGRSFWRSSVVFGPDAVARDIEAVSSSIAEQRTVAPGSCDLVVAIDPSAATVGRVASALTINGDAALIFRRTPDAGSLGRRLARDRLQLLARYTGWPVTDPTRWIPMDDPVATRWLRHAAAAGGLRRPRRWLRWTAWRTRRRLGMLPVVVLVSQAGVRDVRPAAFRRPLPLLDAATPLGSLLARSLGDDYRPSDSVVVLLAAGQRSWSKVVALLLDAKRGNLQSVLKVARAPDEAAGLQRESVVLRALEEHGIGPADGIPLVLGEAVLEGGSFAVVETALPGTPWWISPRTTQAGLARYLDAVTDRLIGLAISTTRTLSGPHARAKQAREILDEFSRSFSAVLKIDPSDRDAMVAAVSVLPVTAEHRDFAPWNLLWSTDGSVGATDWESAELEGWPALDLLYHLAYLAFAAEDAQTTAARLGAYRRARDPGTPVGRLAAQAVDRYARAVRLDPAVLPTLRRFLWAIHARSEFVRAVDDHGPAPPMEVLREGLFVRLWLLETAMSEA